jgi:hypothetical protein
MRASHARRTVLCRRRTENLFKYARRAPQTRPPRKHVARQVSAMLKRTGMNKYVRETKGIPQPPQVNVLVGRRCQNTATILKYHVAYSNNGGEASVNPTQRRIYAVRSVSEGTEE